MSVLLILILASIAIATGFLLAFAWAVKAGQFEDTCTPSMRILAEDDQSPGPRSEVRITKAESGDPAANADDRPIPGKGLAANNPISLTPRFSEVVSNVTTGNRFSSFQQLRQAPNENNTV